MSPENSDSFSGETSPTVSRHPCVTCQRRKVRCDRKNPCTRCFKSGQECTQPDAVRAPRRSRKTQESNVLERVRHLEDSLERMRSLVSQTTIETTEQAEDGADNYNIDEIKQEPLEDSMGRLIVEEEKSRYVSGSAWANLADQVGDLRTLLEDDEANFKEITGTSMQYLTDGIFPSHGNVMKAIYSQAGLNFLWQTYVRYVDPVMKVFHIPTMQAVIDRVLSNASPPTRNIEPLLAAIKFCAITSLSDEDCLENFCTSREALLDMFRSEVQATLNAANFLSSHDLITLQAFVIYLFCNRRREQPRTMWVSCGIAIRLAQSIGLHRDGAVMRLPVLATELRRRLFWELRMLDLGCAEDCGFLPTHIYGADTKIPINCNDEDLHPGDMKPPPEREGFTDMTYVMIRYEMVNRLHGYVPYTNGRSSMGILTGDTQKFPEQSEAVAHFKSIIKQKYLEICDAGIPFQRITIKIGQVILLKMSLIAQYPMFQSSNRSVPISEELKDTLFNNSCDILEYTDELINDPETRRWSWMVQTYVHWHPVAYILNELGTTPNHPQAARAWHAIDLAYLNPHCLTFEANLAIWRPLRGLLERAKAARQRAGADMGVDHITLTSVPTTSNLSTSSDSRLGGGTATFTPDANLVPSDENLMTFDLTTPFATMSDFMTGIPDQNEMDQNWWMHGDIAMSNEINAMMDQQQV